MPARDALPLAERNVAAELRRDPSRSAPAPFVSRSIQMSRGPISQENWQAALKGEPLQQSVEWPLFTDARLTGEVRGELGPYAFLNLVAVRREFRLARPASILRSDMHLPNDLPDMSRTDQTQYHGGTFADEMAALASLTLGIRMKAGGASRIFDKADDAKGKPIAWDSRPDPVLGAHPFGRVLPAAASERSLNDLDALAALPKVEATDAIAFVRSARLYQEGLWVGESDPSLAWLLMVSSVESAANQWRKEKGPATDRLTTAKPDLVAFLKKYNAPGLVDRVAAEFADTIGATRTFINFLLEHLPAPPSKRPLHWAQLSWKKSDLKKTLGLVYKYRSKALHEGVPFPAPMCQPGMAIPNSDVPSEIPTGLASSMLGGVWTAKDTPLLLHTFEYIARNAILSWWKALNEGTIA